VVENRKKKETIEVRKATTCRLSRPDLGSFAPLHLLLGGGGVVVEHYRSGMETGTSRKPAKVVREFLAT
jgi:hypothetical protein